MKKPTSAHEWYVWWLTHQSRLGKVAEVRITEDGQTRITEDGEQRITEGKI